MDNSKRPSSEQVEQGLGDTNIEESEEPVPLLDLLLKEPEQILN